MELAEIVRGAERCADELATLLDERQLWIRSNSPVDPVIGAYLSRAFEIMNSILILAGRNRGHDCQVLARSALELFIELRYITNRDTWERSKRFAKFEAKEIVHARDKYIRRTAVDLSYIRNWEKFEEVAKEFPSAHHWEYRQRLKGGKAEVVPVKLREMAEEGEELDPTLGDIEWAYDFAYGIASDFVHPRPVGMRAHVAEARLTLRRSVGQDSWTETAVVLAVYSFSLSIKRAILFWDLKDLAEKHEQIVTETWVPIMHRLNASDLPALVHD